MRRMLLVAAVAFAACDDSIPGLCEKDSDCKPPNYCYRGTVCVRPDDAGTDAEVPDADGGGGEADAGDAGPGDADPGPADLDAGPDDADAGAGDADAGAADAGPVCTKMAETEPNCGDGVDDDCNGLIDCADSACVNKACRAVAGECDVEEACVAGSPACPADQMKPATTLCRATAGECDVAEMCTGTSALCPADVMKPTTTVCREASGECDVAETCTGTSAQCPADAMKPATTMCRAAAGDCDVAETCTGSSAQCPAGTMKPATAVCRAAAGECDAAETCTGSSAQCPADAMKPATTVCRAAAGACDAAETCTGSSAQCPADAMKPETAVCQAAAGECDVAETCTGSSAQCPADVMKPEGTLCSPDSDPCTTSDTCKGGVCYHGYPVHVATEWSNWRPVPQARADPEFKWVGTGKAVVDTKTCLMWRRDVEPATLSWADASSKCAESVVEGYGAWRLPTRIELLSLVDRAKAAPPTLNEVFFPGTPSSWFWTSTRRPSPAGWAWIVDFSNGQAYTNSTDYLGFLRCVR